MTDNITLPEKIDILAINKEIRQTISESEPKKSSGDIPSEQRYDREHNYNGVTFQLDNFHPDADDDRILIYKVIEQSIRDYLLLYNSELVNEQEAWITAGDFLFDDDYLLQWGTWELSPEELFELINLNIHYFRKEVAKRFAEKKAEDINGST